MATQRATSLEMEMDCSAGARRRPAPVETAAAEPVPEEMRVLAVDDNTIDRKLVEMLLKTSKFKVTAVKNAVRALEVLGLTGADKSPRRTKLDFDLICTDYCMPEMTGFELLRRVKHESSAYKHVPVVIMSSENRPARIARCMAEGAEEFLMKPVKLTDVERMRGYIRNLKATRGDMPSSPTSSAKRKSSSSSASLPGQKLERRARLGELTVA